MIYSKNDTIVAQITPAGKSAVAILRISGKKAEEVSIRVLGKIPKVNYINYLSFLDENNLVIDKGIVLWFVKPHSYTGENVLELQGHGSPVIIDLLLKNITSIPDVRLAYPGEFSERAFLNGKLDLTQAESIIDIINSTSEQAVRLSLQSLQGKFSDHIKKVMICINKIRISLETEINFPEEYINTHFEKIIDDQLQEIICNLINILDLSKKGNILREGKKVVIAGQANAGKSSLFNTLSYTQTAIVTNIKGTTRDLLHTYIHINGIPFELVDTAGLRITEDEIEKIGISRAWQEIFLAEYILFVLDSTLDQSTQSILFSEFFNSISEKNRIIVILNKSDLIKKSVRIKVINKIPFISVSAFTGDGIEFLRQYLYKTSMGMDVIHENNEGLFLARRRHLTALHKSLDVLSAGYKNWISHKNIELLAEDLRITQDYLGQILGFSTTDDLLNSIFSDFCIGK